MFQTMWRRLNDTIQARWADRVGVDSKTPNRLPAFDLIGRSVNLLNVVEIIKPPLQRQKLSDAGGSARPHWKLTWRPRSPQWS
jgi:hypothetical protein